MNHEHHEQLIHLDKEIHEIDTRLNRHLEIYANNGKELKRLGDLVENLIDNLSKLSQDFGEFRKENDPYLGVLKDIGAGKRILKWGLAGLVGLAAGIASVRQIIVFFSRQ